MTDSMDPDRSADMGLESGREDNRNELVEGSPVPDPEAEETDAGDVPEAD